MTTLDISQPESTLEIACPVCDEFMRIKGNKEGMYAHLNHHEKDSDKLTIVIWLQLEFPRMWDYHLKYIERLEEKKE